MQKITQNTIGNNLVFYAKSVLISPKYLLRCINRSTGAEKAFIATNQNAADTDCPLLFSIQESTTESLTTGVARLDPPMNWEIKVYDQTSATNLDYTLANSLLISDYLNVYE